VPFPPQAAAEEKIRKSLDQRGSSGLKSGMPSYRPSFSCLLLALLFAAAGTAHFVKPGFYLKIMPPYLPAPEFLVWLSGVFEVGLGLGLLVPGLRRKAGWGLVLLLLAVLPANVHVALHPEIFPGFPAWAGWARLPLQGALIYWVLRTSLQAPARERG
jgi:uncharacterized membrane protein